MIDYEPCTSDENIFPCTRERIFQDKGISCHVANSSYDDDISEISENWNEKSQYERVDPVFHDSSAVSLGQ